MRIVIDGETNVVSLEEAVVRKEIGLDDFLNAYSANQPMSIPFLPGNCVGMFSATGKTCFIIKRDPGIHTLQYESGGKWDLRLMFPYTYYAITVTNAPITLVPSSCFMFFSNKPVSDLKSVVGYMEMPNVSRQNNIGIICTGSIEIDDGMQYHHAINDIVAKLIGNVHNDDIFESDFSPYIQEAMKECTNAKLKNVKKDDPLYDLAQECIRRNTTKFRYLYTWAHLSQTMKLNEFMDKVTFHSTTTYADAVKEVSREIGVNSW